MKRILILLALLACVSCTGIPPDLIDTSAENIAARHDAYVKADPALSEGERAAYLQETELFLQVIEEAKK